MSKTYDNVAVLIPCYNEGKTIEWVVNDFQKYLPKCRVYVYDNNSKDGTDVIADANGAIVRYEYKQGKGNVIRRMFREIQADCYILVDGDNTYPADRAVEMVDLILNKHYDMVVGDRLSSTYFRENKRPFHNIGNSLVCHSVNKMFKSDIKDVMTGYRAFSNLFVKSFPVLSRNFEIETEMTIHAVDKNMAIKNLVIEYKDRPEGSVSKLNTYTDGVKVIGTIIKMYAIYKPLGFWTTISILLAALSTAFFIPVFMDFIATNEVAKFPTLIVCGFVMLAAIISFFSGIILQTLRHQEKQTFEYRLIDLQKGKECESEYQDNYQG